MRWIGSPLLGAFALAVALATAVALPSTAAPDELAQVAVDDSATVIEDASATRIDVVANDTGPEGGPMVIDAVDTTRTLGEVAITNQGADLTYRPLPDYCNDPDLDPAAPIPDDAFGYTLNGGSTATVSVKVTCVDDGPTAVNDSIAITEDSPLTAIDVLGNDTDVDGGEKRIDAVDAAGTEGHAEIGTDLTRPNIVLILTDDQSFDSVAKMPYLSSRENWYRFENAFINNPTCCPSRATILTGQWSHHTGVEATGGAPRFDDGSTLATWLDAAGYRTGLFGKYHLGDVLEDGRTTNIPPGWDAWAGWHGIAGHEAYYDYTLNENGTLVDYGSNPADYSTDLLATKAVDFILQGADDPFFLYFAPRAPHAPWIPAPRHDGAYSGEPVPHSPNFNEADMSDKPAYWQGLPLRQERSLDGARRKEWATLLAVDDAVKSIVGALKARRAISDTVIVFMTDNGFAYGEHRHADKVCAFEECSRTPLLVRYPGSNGRVFSDLVGNEDIAPTFADLAGATPTIPVDGDSFAPMLRSGEPSGGWPNEILLRGYRPPTDTVHPPEYWGVRTDRYKYVETVRTGETELYDLAADPFELDSLAGQPEYAEVKAQLAFRLSELRAAPPRAVDYSRGPLDSSRVSYVPGPDYCNTDSVGPGSGPDDTFTYALNGGSTATVSVAVSCVDDRPTAGYDLARVTEDAPATTIDVLANDADVDGDPIAVESVDASGAHGEVAITNAGADLTYKPNSNYCNTNPSGSGFGPDDTFTYDLVDGPSGTVSVNVSCVDDAPIAANDTRVVAEDAPATALKVRGNDKDVDGGPKAIESVGTAGTVGSATIVDGGSEVEYKPPADYCNRPGTGPLDTFTYTLNGGSTATVSVKVSCVDDGPTAVDDSATTVEDGPWTTIDVLANDTDIDGGPRTIDAVDTTGTSGVVAITELGQAIQYRPGPNYCNEPDPAPGDTFAYTVNGGSTATVAVEVTCVDDPPLAINDYTRLTEDGRERTIGVLVNDADFDAGPKAIESVDTAGTVGSVAITENARGITYRPSTDYCNRPGIGPFDTFAYTVNGGTAATVSVEVTCVDDFPVAVGDTAAVFEDAPATTIDVLGNDTDVDGGPRQIKGVGTVGTHGIVTIDRGAAGVRYTPDANYCNDPDPAPDDTFTYTLNGGSAATVSVAVSCVPDDPRAVDDSVSVAEDSGFTAINVLANDVDPEGDPKHVQSANVAGTNGIVKIARAGSGVRYQPNLDYCNDPDPAPDDTFTYTLNGGSTATVSVLVGCREG